METTRNTILFLIAVIGGLFAVLTYIDHSLALGITGLFTMGILYWVGKEYVDNSWEPEGRLGHDERYVRKSSPERTAEIKRILRIQK